MNTLKKYLGIILVMVSLVVTIPAWAEDQGQKPISLAEAIELGLRESNAIKVATLSLKQKEVTYKQNRANLLLQPSILSELELENSWRSAQRNFQVTKSNITLKVEELYYNQLLAERALVLAQDNLKRAQKQLENIKTKFSLGTVAKLDLLKSELEVENAQLSVKKAEKNLLMARVNLGSYLTGDPHKTFSLSTQLDFQPLNLDLELCIDYAVKNRPEIREGEETLILNQKRVEVTKEPYYPSLEVELARASLQLANIQLEDSKNSIILEVQQKFTDFLTALDNVPVVQKNREIAQETLNVVQARFDAGVLTVVDLLDAQNDLYEAESNYLNAIFNYNMSKAKLYQSLGINVVEREKYTALLTKKEEKPTQQEEKP
ncbi:MAG: TolC family protein, partial [Candidatus Caldatribacteriaceae bacterium]